MSRWQQFVEYVIHVAESQSIWSFVCNVIVDVTISLRSFVFTQSRAKVSVGLTNVSSLAVTAFDIVYWSTVFVLDISK